MLVALLALACTGSSFEGQAESPAPFPCEDGYGLASDGECYPFADTDADTGADTGGDSGTDTGTPPVDADDDGVPDEQDCDDADASRHPGAQEACDGVDQDCDEEIDEGATTAWYADADGDGWGDPALATVACEAPEQHVADGTDCDDTDAATNPGADDNTLDQRDNDCDGSTDEDADACSVPLGSFDLAAVTAVEATSPYVVSVGFGGDGYVCDVTCADTWLSAEGVTLSWEGLSGTTYEPLPYLVDGNALFVFRLSSPAAGSVGTCEARTSAGDFTFEIAYPG